MDSTLFSSKRVDTLKNIFTKNKIIFAGVFGSYAKGTATRSSDVDLLIRFNPKSRKTLFDLVAIRRQVRSVLKTDVDLVTFESLNKYIKDEVINTVKIIYGKRQSIS